MAAADRTPRPRERAPRPGRSRPAPLYERLPHGPHRLDRRTVLMHQRSRIHGALVEALARNGYCATTVGEITALAGVSRRAFYEQFANKEDCFAATFDLIATRAVRRARAAYRSVDGPAARRLGAALRALAEAAREERNAAALVAVHAQLAGAPALARRRAALAACERLLERSLAAVLPSRTLPGALVRGLAGGLDGAFSRSLRTGRDVDAEALLRWALLFEGGLPGAIGERLTARVTARLASAQARANAEHAGEPGRRRAGAATAPARGRAALLRGALRVAVLGEWTAPSAARVADEAGVPVEAFHGLFCDPEACMAAALDELAAELLAAVAAPPPGVRDWPAAVRAAIDRLLAHLATRPLHARVIAEGAFSAGERSARRNLALAHELAGALLAGAPGEPCTPVAREAIAGALWHTIGHHAVLGRARLLPALGDHLACLVLAPYLGGDRALAVVTEAPRA